MRSSTTQILLFLFTFIPFLSSAQEKVNDFDMSFFETPTYDILATEEKGGEIKYYINMYSTEGKSSLVVLMIEDAKDMGNFVADVMEAKQTYIKWDSVSVANSVTDLEKQMSVSTSGLQTAFVYGSGWNFDFSNKLTYDFKHVDKVPTLIIRTGKLQSSENQFIDSDGGIFAFSSVEEIDGFISALEPHHAEEFFANKKNKESLFED